MKILTIFKQCIIQPHLSTIICPEDASRYSQNLLVIKVESILRDKVRKYSHLLTIELTEKVASTNIVLYRKRDHFRDFA